MIRKLKIQRDKKHKNHSLFLNWEIQPLNIWIYFLLSFPPCIYMCIFKHSWVFVYSGDWDQVEWQAPREAWEGDWVRRWGINCSGSPSLCVTPIWEKVKKVVSMWAEYVVYTLLCRFSFFLIWVGLLSGDSGASLISITQVFLLKLSNGCTTQTCAYLADIYWAATVQSTGLDCGPYKNGYYIVPALKELTV